MPATIWRLYVAALVNRLGNSAIVFLAVHLRNLGLTPGQAGVVLTAYGVGSIVASLLGGYLSDRWSPQKVIAGSAVFACIGFALLAYAHDYETVVALSFSVGVAAEMYRPAANVLVAELVPPENRVTAFVGYRLFTNVGFALGPALAGVIAMKSSGTVFLVAAAACLVYAGLVLFGVRTRCAEPIGERAPGGSAIPVIMKNKKFVVFLVSSFLAMFILMQYQSTFSLFALDLGVPASGLGFLIGLNGVLVVLLSIPLAALTARLKPSDAIALGFVLAGVGFGLNSVAGGFGSLILVVAITTIGEVIFLPRGTSYVIDVAPLEMRARHMSALEAVWSFALLAAPGVGIALYENLGSGFWVVCAGAGIVAAGAMRLANRVELTTESVRSPARSRVGE